MANTARFESASELVTTAAVEVGLPFNSAPFSSSDPAYRQLIKLLNVCGRELALMPGWNMQVREGSFTVVDGQTAYDLPDDFMALTEDTVWNRGTSWPMSGSATPQTWTLWARENPALTIQVIFRLAARKFVIPPNVIPAGTVLAYEYKSRAWVLSGTQVEVYKDKVDDPGDIVLFEPVLVTRMLVFKFLRAKGFESNGAFTEFQTILDMAKSQDKPAEVYNLSNNARGARFLNEDNLPDTGFGD